jgi:nucleotide-binding universal stress UspA family protein
MPMRIRVERILCPTDFSKFSAAALERAARLASWFHSSVTVLNVIPPTPWVYPAQGGLPSSAVSVELLRAQREETQRELERAVAPFRARGVAIETRLGDGEPSAEIQTAAEALQADLIVMGTHGYGGFKRLLLGSVAEKMLRRAPCPVLTVGADTSLAASGLLFRRILCAVDLTDASDHTLDLALSLAEENLARLTLLHVVETLPGESAAGLYLSVPQLGPLRQDLGAQAHERLHRLSNAARSLCEMQERVEFGTAWHAIVKQAQAVEADLIVVGAHTRGPLASLFLGATANHVVREASCPVLVVRDTARARHSRAELTAAHAAG